MVTKGHTYLNKPVAKSYSFCMIGTSVMKELKNRISENRSEFIRLNLLNIEAKFGDDLLVGDKAKRANLKHVSVSGGKKCSFFGKSGVLYFLVTSVLRFPRISALYLFTYIPSAISSICFYIELIQRKKIQFVFIIFSCKDFVACYESWSLFQIGWIQN